MTLKVYFSYREMDVTRNFLLTLGKHLLRRQNNDVTSFPSSLSPSLYFLSPFISYLWSQRGTHSDGDTS